MSKLTKRILFLVQHPPPIHGVSLMNQYIKDSSLINLEFNCNYINLTTTQSIKDIGKHSVKKYFSSCLIYLKLIQSLIGKKYNLCYVTLSPHGIALVKDALVVFICKLFRKKVIIHLHGKGIKREIEDSVIKKLFYKFIFHNTAVICLSSLLIDDIKSVFKGTPYILANGLPDHASKYNKLYTTDKTIKILFLSNMVISKGILDLLRSLKALHDNGVNFSCHLVGKEGDISFDELQKIIDSYHLTSKVFIQGAKYCEDKLFELQIADFFVFPTSNDAFPLVLLEAMMFGLPVITTYEGAIPEIVKNDVTGYLCQQNNTIELAEKIKLFIDHSELIEKFGKAARQKYVDCYQLEAFETNFIDIMKQVAAK